MTCSSVNLDRFIAQSFLKPDSGFTWTKYRGAQQGLLGLPRRTHMTAGVQRFKSSPGRQLEQTLSAAAGRTKRGFCHPIATQRPRRPPPIGQHTGTIRAASTPPDVRDIVRLCRCAGLRAVPRPRALELCAVIALAARGRSCIVCPAARQSAAECRTAKTAGPSLQAIACAGFGRHAARDTRSRCFLRYRAGLYSGLRWPSDRRRFD